MHFTISSRNFGRESSLKHLDLFDESSSLFDHSLHVLALDEELFQDLVDAGLLDLGCHHVSADCESMPHTVSERVDYSSTPSLISSQPDIQQKCDFSCLHSKPTIKLLLLECGNHSFDARQEYALFDHLSSCHTLSLHFEVEIYDLLPSVFEFIPLFDFLDFEFAGKVFYSLFV